MTKRFTSRIASQLRANRRAEEKHFVEWHALKAERDAYKSALETIRNSTAATAVTLRNVARLALERRS